MAWDVNSPANNVLLRLLPFSVRVHWSAIQNGLVPYSGLKLAEQGANPSQEDNFGKLFTKEVGGQTQLFYQDDTATPVVSQLTNSVISSHAINGGNAYGFKTPFGLTLNWGNGLFPAGPTPSLSVTWEVPFTVFQSVTAMFLNQTSTLSGSLTSGGESALGTTFYGAGSRNFGFIAIGV